MLPGTRSGGASAPWWLAVSLVTISSLLVVVTIGVASSIGHGEIVLMVMTVVVLGALGVLSVYVMSVYLSRSGRS